MIRISNIKMPLDTDHSTLLHEAARRLRIPAESIIRLELFKKSIDARSKKDVHFVYTVDVYIENEEMVFQKSRCKTASILSSTAIPIPAQKSFMHAPIVVGSGPAGLFAALVLAEAGTRPIIIERGDDVETRTKRVDRFWKSGLLDTDCNVQFGEGGAGTFSDGKLNTGTRDIRQRKVLTSFVDCGAPAEILYLAKPHIGTDRLYHVVRNLREKIIALGGQVLFRHKLTQLIEKDGSICGIECETPNGATQSFETRHVILAIGHSARDTFSMLCESGVPLIQKSFSVGVRIEHLQKNIDAEQYGRFAGHPALPAADYKLAAHLDNGRSIYTFCMCPGGIVVAAASEAGGVVTNGMSFYARNKTNANSAVLVNITPADFVDSDPLAGVAFQRELEQRAFFLGGSNYRAPAQTVEDFFSGVKSTSFDSVIPSYLPGVTGCNLPELFPEYITCALRDGIRRFDRMLYGFANPHAVMTGVESRSSSPVRIVRDETMQSNLRGLYPCGEGAGYAGGILSAAVDGIRVAEAVLEE